MVGSMMEFLKFTILDEKADQQIGIKEQAILFNRNHIVSIKPINILITGGDVLKGYWIRTTNGKKYKATSIPADIGMQLGTLTVELPTDEDPAAMPLN